LGKTNGGFTAGIDLKRVLNKYARNWYLFVIAILAAYFFASVKNRYVVPIYRLSTSVLIEDKSNKSVLEARGSISDNPLFLNSKLIDNQIAILKSFSQVRKIIGNLDFEVSYFAKGKYIWEEIYKRAPFLIVADSGAQEIKLMRFDLRLTGSGKYQLWSDTIEELKKPRNYRLGEKVAGGNFSFAVILKEDIRENDYLNQVYGFMFNDLNRLTSEYRQKTIIEPVKEGSVIVISSTGPNKDKEKDYLNELTRVFLRTNLEKKNKILTNTIEFINGQIAQIGVDLDSAEQKLEEFRKDHKFMQLSAKAAMILNEMNNESKSRASLLGDLNYYEYLLNYLNTHQSFEDVVMPSTVGLSLPLFSDLVLKLSTVSLEKEDLIANSSRSNPYIQTLEEQISNMKNALTENMTSIIATTNIKIRDSERRLLSKDSEFALLPGIERAYLEIERKYKVFNSLYDFLLQRKSEVEIQRAANTPDHEIIDYAGEAGITKVSANPKTAYINAFIWALLIPAAFLFLIVLFNNRIISQEDIMAITRIPVIGTLLRNTDKRTGKLLLHANSQFTEMLRMIKIKLALDPLKGEQVISVTSSSIGDGKTYLAKNLASIYALAGKRTLLLGFDLQRPKIAEEFDLPSNEGITNFLINDIPVQGLIRKTVTKNLDIMLSGPVPPNPDELIESDKTQLLFSELRKRYEFIIMDTPAIGFVGDAFLLNRYSDVTLFVVRYNVTVRKLLAEALTQATENRMKRINIILTDMKQSVRFGDTNFSLAYPGKRHFLLRALSNGWMRIIGFLRSF
jgi:capsular exopolysaccharide synthesis family protein